MIFEQILNEPLNLEPIEKLKLPPVLSEVISRCTAKNPAQRPQSIGWVCEQLEELFNAAPPPKSVTPDSEGNPTIITIVAAPPPMRSPRIWEFLEKLPSGLQSQGGLMLLASTTVLAALVVFFVILHLLHLL